MSVFAAPPWLSYPKAMPATTATFAPPRDAQALVDVVRLCYARGWAPATSSNYSLRDPDMGGFWVSRSGVDKSAFVINDLVAVDMQGRPHSAAAPKTSAETGLHAALYARTADIGCVLHTHSRAATVLSRYAAAAGFLCLSGYELLKAFRGVDTHQAHIELPVLQNSQDIDALATAAHAALDRRPRSPGYLIVGHGLYTWGADVETAWRHLEALEFLLDCELYERLLR